MSGHDEPAEEPGLTINQALAYPVYPLHVPTELIMIGLVLTLLLVGLLTLVFGLPLPLLAMGVFPVWHAYWMIRVRRNPYYIRTWTAYLRGAPRPAAVPSRMLGRVSRDVVHFG